jgi:hypothetical protein
MTRPAPKPLQFGLRSIFLATSAVGLALGVFKWLGHDIFVLTVQLAAVVAILVKSRGTALRGVVILGTLVAFPMLGLAHFHVESFVVIGTWASLAAWFGGWLASDAEARKRSRFVRWAWLLGLIWFWSMFVFGTLVSAWLNGHVK